MLRRTALVLLGLLVTAAAGIFAADHLGVNLPWKVASTTVPEQVSKDSETSPPAEETPASASSTAESAIEETVAALVDDTPESAEPAPGSVALDISRVSPDGPSVFAGRAEPGAYVTVFADGKPAGTVQADESGSWSLSTEHRFASTDPSITFESAEAPPAEPETPATETAAAEETPAEPPADDAAPPAVAGDVMRKFEELVSEAREDAAREKAAEEEAERAREAERKEAERKEAERREAERKEREAAERETAVAAATEPTAPPSGTPAAAATEAEAEAVDEEPASETKASASADAVPGATSTVGAETAQKATETETAMVAAPGRSRTGEPEAQAPIPVPIMFVYNQATLTPEGERAADLLLEYLMLKRLESVELTGHADERGTHDYNFELSRERLETVARILKDGGYKGDLKLTPKGKTEPFRGIDRTKYRGEALYQFDRRVELRVTPR